MASAEKIYVDPSALLKLYLHEPESRRLSEWRAKIGGSLGVTHFGRVELVNALGLAVHRRIISKAAHRAALAALDDDFAQGRYEIVDLLWRAALRRAEDISRDHTPLGGCRTLDVLHVASAIVMKSRQFLTFDLRQQKLALASGLKLIRLG